MKKKKRGAPGNQTRYYHGGYPGLRINDVLSSKGGLKIGGADYGSGKIFFTTSVELATGYALQHARKNPPGLGSVYELEVSGPMRVDEDYVELAPSRGGPFSFSVKAPPRITRVRTTLGPDPAREHRLFAPFQTWASPDGRIYPVWTQDGYVIPAPHEPKGVTVATLQAKWNLGPFPGLEALIAVGYYDPAP